MITTLNFTRHQLSILLDHIRTNAFNDRSGIFVVNCKRLVEFCQRNPLTNEVLSLIERADVNYDEWNELCEFSDDGFAPYWGAQKDSHICWKTVQEIANISDVDSTECLITRSAIGSTASGADEPIIILHRYIIPFVNYLIEHLNTQYLILTTLQRFIQRCQQFDKTILYSRYQKDVEQATRQGEAQLDRELRRYLFDQGIDTLSSPHGGTGRVDIVSIQPEALAIEVKLYCPRRTYPNGFEQKSNYDVTYLKQGFHQLQQAVVSYGSGYGVLFVFNLSNESLSFDTNQSGPPPAILLNGKTYYIFHVDLYPHLSDSRTEREPLLINTQLWHEGQTDGI